MFLYGLDSLVNIFVGGRSLVKLAAFFLYLFSLVVISFLIRHKKCPDYSWSYFGIGLLAVYLYNLLLEVSYTWKYHLSLNDYLIIGHNGQFSSSSLFHTHLAKGIIGQIFSWFHLTPLSGVDYGAAYVGLFPGWLFGLGAGLLIGLIGLAIFYFATSFQKILRSKTVKQRIILIGAYAILSFSLIESAIDGGIFSRAFLAALGFIPLFIRSEQGKTTAVGQSILTAVGLILLTAGWWPFILSYSKLNEIYALGALLLLYSLLFYLYNFRRRYSRWWPLIFLSLSFVFSWWLSSWRLRDIYHYAATPLPAGTVIYYYDNVAAAVRTATISQSTTVGHLTTTIHKNHLRQQREGVSHEKR
jgi:hypothetical protein